MALSSPSFALGETNVKVPIGRDAILNCTVHNSGTHKVAWIDSLRGVVLTVEEDVVTGNPRVGIRHSVTPNGADSWVLSVKAVTMKDAGTYMCQVSTKAGLRLLYNLSVVDDSLPFQSTLLRGSRGKALGYPRGVPIPPPDYPISLAEDEANYTFSLTWVFASQRPLDSIVFFSRGSPSKIAVKP
ncbi:zwei Ig domain protein zig-8-like [Penaeus chinensis]|uniref:zwei Ig domain protein zig-8-like n=1 Tax=Penaeus chinensis TaxID=139456 RepID=UPI001FB6D816|nr:zwei Ig domain protein zig-8-like [Penaeus chinensis]